ncbi:MAG: glycosyltransferase family 4 protein [Balneolaceae bacterium]
MNILYFHQHFSTPAGSTGTRSYEMARALIDRGHKVTMVCGSYQLAKSGLGPGADQAGVKRGVVDGIDVIEFQLPYSNNDSFLKRTYTFLKYSLKSSLLPFKEPFDLLFATSTPLTAGIPGIIMKRFKSKKFVFEVRDLWPELPREMGVITNPAVLKGMDFLEWSSYKSADGCIALSPGIKDGIERRSNQKPIEMIPNGCDLDLFTPNGDKANIPGVNDDDFVALFTGAHGIANGLDAAIDAASELQNRKEENIKMVFIGDGREKERLIRRSEEMGLKNCLFFDPVPKTELPAFLRRANVGLMLLQNIPAFYYGTSPNKFFDYISSGLPVLNNYPGWVAELIAEYQCGMAIEPDSPKTFADALVKMKNRSDVVTMGKNARALAEKKFNRKNLSNQFADFLEKIYRSA